MAERDAFGNEKGTNGLAGLGWNTAGLQDQAEGTTARPAEPAPTVSVGSGAPAPAANAASPPPFTVPGWAYRPSRLGRTIRVVIMMLFPVAVVGTVAIAIVVSVGHSANGVGQFRRGLNGLSVPTVPRPTGVAAEASERPAAPPAGFGKGSLLLKSNFAGALRMLRDEGSRVQMLRVAPDRIDASMVTNDGRHKEVQVTWQGELQRLSTSPLGFSKAGTFSLDVLQSSTPFRLARSAAGRAKRSPAGVDYLVARTVGLTPKPRWSAFLKNGAGAYAADAHGRIVHKIG